MKTKKGKGLSFYGMALQRHMSTPTSSFLKVLTERGYIHQTSDLEGLDTHLNDDGPVSAYIGFDCTADSLHVGGLIQIMMLRRLQQAGHRPVILLGGGTTRIGDPSGKDTARQMLSDEDIANNMAGIRKVFEKYITFGDGPTDALFVNNADWLDELKYIDVLRDVGRHMSVNRMLTMDSVKLRIEREQPLSLLEFNYMVLQAYDFTELHRRYGLTVQMGGSDQWGNIVTGIDLGRRMNTKQLYAITSPLLTTSSGAKMGKTAQGAIWLNEERLSAYDFWQFWRNTEDADVGKFLRLFTELDLTEIARLESLQGAELNEAKKTLANAVTTLAHGAEAAEAAAETARKTFEEGASGANLPRISFSTNEIAAGLNVVDALAKAFDASKGEMRRLIKQGGAKINGSPITDQEMSLTPDLFEAGEVKISAGKKRHALLIKT